jgi:hypothetical protein
LDKVQGWHVGASGLIKPGRINGKDLVRVFEAGG